MTGSRTWCSCLALECDNRFPCTGLSPTWTTYKFGVGDDRKEEGTDQGGVGRGEDHVVVSISSSSVTTTIPLLALQRLDHAVD